MLSSARRQPFTQRRQRGEIRRTFSGHVLEGGIGALRQQEAGNLGPAAFGRNHQSRAAAGIPVIGEVENDGEATP